MLRTALTLAILLSSTSSGAAPRPGESAPVASPPPPLVEAPLPPDAPPPRRSYLPAVWGELGTTLGFGVAPRTAVGMTANIGHYWRVTSLPFDGVSLLYSLRWDAPAAGYVPGQGKDALVHTERILIMLDPCVHRGILYGCAVFGGGRFGIEWEAPARTGGGGRLQIHNPPIFVTGGRLGVDVPFLSRFGVRVSGELLTTLNPATFPIDERMRWTIPRVSGGFEVGLYYSPDPR